MGLPLLETHNGRPGRSRGVRPWPLALAAFAALALAISGCGGWGTAQDHYNEGVRLKERGRLLEAITAYDRALRVDPHYAAAFNNRGATYVNLGRHQEALKDLNEALRLKPAMAEAYVNRALAYAFLGEDAAAQQNLQKGAELGFDTAVPSAFIEKLKAQR